MTDRSAELIQQSIQKGMVQVGRLLGLLFLAWISMVWVTPVYAATSSASAAGSAVINVMEGQPLMQDGGNTAVGRYALNYTGNTNFTGLAQSSGDIESFRSVAIPGTQNSSVATLSSDSGSTVVKAYLVWETRRKYDRYDEATNHVTFISATNKGTGMINIYPDRVYVDNRNSRYVSGWEADRPRIYTNVADVSNIVKAYGYGNYYVANIPEFHIANVYGSNAAGGDTGGGGTIARWQLIVVEENASYPVRAVTLSIGSTFRFGDYDWERNDYGYDEATRAMISMRTQLGSGLKTKSYGSASGQVLAGIEATNERYTQQLEIFTQPYADGAESVYNVGLITDGIWKNGQRIQSGHGSVFSLVDVPTIANSATVFGGRVTGVHWNTCLFIGAAVDIAFPDFSSRQTTTLSDGKVIVKGTITNVSPQQSTGIYDGNLTVTLDPSLAVENYQITVNGSSTSGAAVRQDSYTDEDGKIHPVLIFFGGGVSSFYKGDKIEYTVTCQIRNSGATRFDNRDAFHGYLQSEGVPTGYWINQAWTSSSYVVTPAYTISYAPNGATAGSMESKRTGAAQNYQFKLDSCRYSWQGHKFEYYAVVRSSDQKVYCRDHTWKPLTVTKKEDWCPFYPNAVDGVTHVISQSWTPLAGSASDTFVFYAQWQLNESTLKIDPNGGTWQGGTAVQSFTEHYGTAKSIPDPVRTGYTFSGWVKSETFYGKLNNAVYTFSEKDGVTDVLTASWTANSYTLHFDPNDGKEQTPIDDITITYDQEVVLPDATGQYIRYTLDGEDITQHVLDGTIVLDDAGRVVMMMDADTGLMMTPTGGVVNEDGSITNPDGSVADPEAADADASDESMEALEEEVTEADASGKAVEEPKEETTEPDASGESMEVPEASGVEEDIDVQVAEPEEMEDPEEAENPTADPVPDKKAYASVFMGWALEDGRESFIPQWTAGTSIAVADLTNAAGVTDQNGATITLYAVWDDCPWIVAENLYYTLTQAQSGYITDSEILSHATAYDREDGSPIEPGFHENGTSFSIPDYQASDFTQFRREGSCTENLTVVDSTGSTYYKQITVYVIDTTAVAVEPEGTTRFINEYYYNQPEANGGLAADSIWLTDPEYAAALQTAFANSRNGSAEEVYEFSHEDILAMKQFIDDNGFGNTRSDDALTRFYNQFMAPNKVE